MKKNLALFTILMFLAVCFAQTYQYPPNQSQLPKPKKLSLVTLQLNAGYDFSGKQQRIFRYSNGDDEKRYNHNAKPAFSPGAELLFRGKTFCGGIGAEYQLLRELDLQADSVDFMPSDKNPKFGFWSAYLVFKVKAPILRDLGIELITQAGYSEIKFDKIYQDNIENDLYTLTYDVNGGYYFGVGLDFIISNKVTLQVLYKGNSSVIVNSFTTNYDGHSDNYEINVDNTQIQAALGLRL